MITSSKRSTNIKRGGGGQTGSQVSILALIPLTDEFPPQGGNRFSLWVTEQEERWKDVMK